MKKTGLLTRFRKAGYRRSEVAYGYLFIAPFYLLFLVFQLYPMLWSLVLSFYEWNGIGPQTFVGLRNYAAVLRDPMFWDAMVNTFWYLAVNLIFILPLSVLLGQLLCAKGLRGRRAHKTVQMLPYITSTAAAGIIFGMLFDVNIGVVNEMLQTLGLPAIPWLTSIEWSKVPVMILSIWRNTPWYMLIVMSAMLGVDANLYEAARIDGANAFQRMIYITLPAIRPTLFFNLINLTIDSARIFTEPYILTSGGPGTSSLSVVQYLYESGFTSFQLGYASAIGYALTLVLLAVSILYFIELRRQSKEDQHGPN